VDVLRRLDRVDTVRRLMRRNKELEDEVHALKKTLYVHTGRPYPASSMYSGAPLLGLVSTRASH
jgi:hypothetical protein